MCTRSKQTNIILVILFFISFQVFSLILFSTFDEPKNYAADHDKKGSSNIDLDTNRIRGCDSYEYTCKNHEDSQPKCILREKMCDNIPDCPYGDDESDYTCEDFFGYKIQFQDTNKTTTTPSTTLETTTQDYKKTKSCINIHCDLNHPLVICCNSQNISDLSNVLFQHTVRIIKLDNNNISHLDKGPIQNLSQMTVFSAAHNELTELDKDLFSGARKLKRMFLANNRLTSLPVDIFRNSPEIKFMILRNNLLANLDLEIFAPLKKMFNLELSCNHLTLENQSFPYNERLRFLYLNENQIERITDLTFKNLPGIIRIELQFNRILSISPDAFNGKPLFQDFVLSFNRISEHTLSSKFLDPITSLETLDLSYNQFNYLPQDMFQKNEKITSLNLEGLSIYNVSLKHFDSLNKLKFIYFPHFRYCMYVPYVNSCQPFFDRVSSLRNLLAVPLLKFLVWSVSILIVSLNFMVLFFRSIKKKRDDIILTTLVKLLSISDSLIGFYMLAIGYFDLKFGDKYHKVALEFVNSWQCTGLGALAVFSKQFSLFIVLIISFDRNRLITLQNFRFSSIYYFFLVAIGFLLSLFIALFPIIFWSSSNKNNVYFAANMLCYPLHLAEPFLLGWQFNAAINILINLPIVSTIIILYSHMYFIIKKNRKYTRPAIRCTSKNNVGNFTEQTPNGSTNMFTYLDQNMKSSLNNTLMARNSQNSTISEDGALAIRLFFIVATDCICWLPTIFIKIAALFNLRIPALLNAWIIIVILPINCMLNPIIYTIAAPKRLSKLSRTSYNLVKKKLMNLFKIRPKKSADMRRKSSDSGDYRTSSGLNQDAINLSQITMQCLERKSSNEQAIHDFTTYLDCNNNEDPMPSKSLIKSSVTKL